MTSDRKADHVDICLTENVDADHNYWDDITPVHRALPEIDFDSIDTSVTIFDKTLSAPLVIAAMTGGFSTDKYDAEIINGNLAEAAARAGVGLGVGSQRVAVAKREMETTFSIVKEHKVPLIIGNMGAPQLVSQKGENKPITIDDMQYAKELVGADIMALHLNFLQEVCMTNGDLNAAGCLEAIGALAKEIPILAKETGAGITREVAESLKSAGVAGLDIGGLSGTSFAAVEKHRATRHKDILHARVGSTFENWGIPSPISVLEAKVGIPVIATGGIRTGLDAARAVMLGANSAGIARRLLPAAVESANAVYEELEALKTEIKSTMFLLGTATISELKKCNYILSSDLLLWYNQRILHYKEVV